MEIQLKQRLIGAVVIFTLLIIFLPMFFDQDNETQNIEQLLTPLSSGRLEDNPVIDSKEISDFIADNSVLLSQNDADNTKLQAASQKDKDIHINTPVNTPVTKRSSGEQATKIKTQVSPEEATDSENTIVNTKEEAVVARINNNLTIVEKLKAAEEQAQIQNKKQVPDRSLDKVSESTANKTIKYNISTSLGATDVYAVRVSATSDASDAEKIKNRLLSMGFPAYTHKTSTDFVVLVGPDLELKYVKELANRILDETNYQPEVISHNKNWVSSD